MTVRPEVFEGYSVDAETAKNAYLPDDQLLPHERAINCLFRVAAEEPFSPAALTIIPTVDGGRMLAVSLFWNECTQVDLLFNFALEIEETQWVTCRSVSKSLNNLMEGSHEGISLPFEAIDVPVWAENFAPLVERQPLGNAVTIIDGTIQKFSSALADHHAIASYDLTEEERRVLFESARTEIGGLPVMMNTLITIGTLNPFGSLEQLNVVNTEKGSFILGQQVIVGPR